MSIDNGALAFDTYFNNERLVRTAAEAERKIKGLSGTAINESKKMEDSFSGVGKALGLIGGTAAIGMLGKQILDTTAKFEKFGIVLRNTLGQQAGSEALEMIANFAATTPFQLDEVTDSFIRMANQGFVPTRDQMVSLGDLASSTGKSFNQLSEAILDAQTGEFERLKEFGIKASQNGDKVTFSFREQQTTVDKTNSSIRDYILSLGQLEGIQGANALISESLTGQISNLQDKLAAMFNEIGTANSGVLYTALSVTSSLIDNYETVGKVLIALVGTYGAYKTAVIIATATTKGYSLAMQVEYAWLLMVEKALLLVDKAMLKNPYVIAALAISGLVIALASLADGTKEVITQKQILSDLEKESQNNVKQEVSTLNSLKKILNDTSKSYKERNTALNKIKAIVPDYHASLTAEGKLINNNADALDRYVKKLVITEKIKIAATKQSAADEAYDAYKDENKDVLRNALNKRVSGGTLFAGEKAAIATLSKLAEEAQNYGDVIDGLQADLVKVESETKPAEQGETEAQRLAREKAEQKNALKAKNDFSKEELAAQKEAYEAELSARRQQIKDKKTLIKLDYEETLKEIDAKEKVFKDSAKAAGIESPNLSSFSTMRTAAKTVFDNENQEVDNEELKRQNAEVFNSAKEQLEKLKSLKEKYTDEIKQIEEEYNAEIALLQGDLYSSERDKAKQARDEKVSAINEGLIAESEAYKLATDDKLMASKEATEKLIADIKARIEAEVAAGKITSETANKMLAEINTAQVAVQGNKAQNNPFAQLGSAIKGNNTAKKALKSFDPSGLSAENAKTQLAGLESAAASATASMAGAAGSALMGVQQILGSVVDGMDRLGMLTDEEKKDAENVIGMVGGAADIAMGIASGNPMQIIQGSINLIVNAFELFDKKSKDIARKQKNLVKQVDNLKDAYERLERAVSKAFSTDSAKLQQKEIDNLQAQIRANNQWIALENEKKKKKQDKDAIDARRKENEALRNAIEDKKDEIIESLTGTSVMSAIDQFANAYADAFTSGEDAALKSSEAVRSIFKSALIEKLKSDLQPGIMQLMNMVSDAMADGILTADEKAAIELKKKEQDAVALRNQKAFDELGLNDEANKKGALSGSIQNVSEETASVISGQMNAMRINQIESQNIMRNQLLALNQIASNTAYNINLVSILAELKAMNTNNSLRSQGL